MDSTFLHRASQMVPLVQWNTGLEAARPISLADEVRALPTTYQKRRGFGEIEAIENFYRGRVDAPKIPTGELDLLAMAYLEKKYPETSYYHGYLRGNDHQGNPANYPIRVVGFIPKGDIRGTVFHAKGFGHTAWENHPDLPGKFMDLGLSYFSFDLPGHGMSARPYDPKIAAFRSSRLFIEHTSQAIDCVSNIVQNDPRLQGRPLFGIGSSLGATALTGAMADKLKAGHTVPFHRVIFDSPFWSFGSDWPRWKRLVMRGSFHLSKVAPSLAFWKKSPPKDRPSLAEGFYQENLANYHAFGPTLVPLPMFDLPDLLRSNTEALVQFATKLPPAALFVFPEDPQIDPEGNKALFSRFTHDVDGNGLNCIVNTFDHAAFSAQDTSLMRSSGIVDRFFFDRFSAPLARAFTPAQGNPRIQLL